MTLTSPETSYLQNHQLNIILFDYSFLSWGLTFSGIPSVAARASFSLMLQIHFFIFLLIQLLLYEHHLFGSYQPFSFLLMSQLPRKLPTMDGANHPPSHVCAYCNLYAAEEKSPMDRVVLSYNCMSANTRISYGALCVN